MFQGAVVQSSGSLENSEHVAKVVRKTLEALRDFHPDQDNEGEESFKKMSFLYTDHAYVVVRSGRNIRVIHRRVAEVPTLDEI